MIYCLIDGMKAYPSTGSNIKLTLENPFIKSSGDHTMQVSFPLDIPENRVVFGNINRIDVSKSKTVFEDCSLLCGTTVLLRGSGKLTSFSEKEVRLQLLGTSSNVKTKAEGLYIDEVFFPEMIEPYLTWCKKSNIGVDASIVERGFGGVKGEYVFFTVVNDTTGRKYNRLRCYNNGTKMVYWLKRPAVQVNVMFVLKYVLKALGYELVSNVYDVTPWNELYIVNLRRTPKINKALPHWKVSTFLDEFQKLFNAVFIYDDVNMKVSIESYSDLQNKNRVEYKHEEAFSSDFDEEGVSYVGSNNIKYDLVTCSDQKYAREIPDDIFESFDYREYNTLAEMLSAEGSRTKKELLTTLYFMKDCGYVYWRIVDEEQGIMSYQICGFFDTLVKKGNKRSSNTTELKMVPVPIGESFVNESVIEDKCMMPCIEGPENEADSKDDEEDVITVQDVLEDEMSVEKEEEDEHMYLAFLESKTAIFYYDGRNDRYYGIMKAFADRRESNVSQSWSLSLIASTGIVHNVGKFHKTSVTIGAHNQYVQKFLCDEIPDPKNIYLFRNKPFLCSKIDLSINDDGVDRMKTGYFYEIL